MALITATIAANAQSATAFIEFVYPGWPPYVVATLAAPTSPLLTDPYPTITTTSPIELVADTDGAGNPGPENRMPRQVESRSDTLRRLCVIVIRTLNLLYGRFLDRDGVQATGTTHMRGNLDLGGFKVIKLADATASGGLVTKKQLDAVSTSYQDNVQQVVGASILRRDGALAMQRALSMSTNPAAPTGRVINLGVPSATGRMERKTDLDATALSIRTDYLDLLGVRVMTGTLDMRDTPTSTPNRITNVGTPTAAAHAATKGYADSLTGGIGIPFGAILPHMGAFVHPSFQPCDGRDLDRALYSALFAVIGTTFGSSSSTTFKVPDLRGRVLVGLDNLGGAAAGRVTDPQATILGGAFGTQTHILAFGELPAHTHTRDDKYFASGSAGALVGKTTPNTVSALVTTPRNTSSAGLFVAHNNVQPTLVCVWIIRADQQV